MTRWTEIKKVFLRVFPMVPKELKEGYQVDAQSENARRLKILGLIVASVAIVLLCLKSLILPEHNNGLPNLFLVFNIGILTVSILTFCVGYFAFIGRWDIRSTLFSVIIQLVGILMILWAFGTSFYCMIGPVGDWIYLGVVFTVLSLILLSFSEMMFVLVVVLCIQIGVSEIAQSNIDGQNVLAISIISFIIAGIVSRILYFSRIRNYLNWENINQMNQTLKREVSMHLRTTEDLRKIRKNLDRKVHDQTKDLRSANQRLSEEVADRRYADKVRNILYRISTFVNQNQNLDQVFQFIQTQLESVMEVRNLLIAKTNSKAESSALFQISDLADVFDFEDNEKSLVSLVISGQRSILLNRKDIFKMVQDGRIVAPTIFPESWIGVPILFDDSLIGVQIVQSFKKGGSYDRTDVELLEYVSEHVATAMAREENDQILICAKEKAEESDRLKSSFLANLSHEIRTPMNAIVGFSELIGSNGLEDKDRKYYATQVVNNSHYLLKLISDIIELSKVQSGQVKMTMLEQNIHDSILGSLESYNAVKVQHEREHLDIEFDIDSKLKDAMFVGDLEGFKQIMLCLVENALKFTNEGKVVIGARPYDNKYIEFYVEDTGIGIEESEVKHIFDYFRQGSLATRQLYRGTGLGLALAKALVEEHGGQIWVKSNFKSGSCFSFTMKQKRHTPTIDIIDSGSEDDVSHHPNLGQATAG